MLTTIEQQLEDTRRRYDGKLVRRGRTLFRVIRVFFSQTWGIRLTVVILKFDEQTDYAPAEVTLLSPLEELAYSACEEWNHSDPLRQNHV